MHKHKNEMMEKETYQRKEKTEVLKKRRACSRCFGMRA
jgi:ribosomal protein S27AE